MPIEQSIEVPLVVSEDFSSTSLTPHISKLLKKYSGFLEYKRDVLVGNRYAFLCVVMPRELAIDKVCPRMLARASPCKDNHRYGRIAIYKNA